MFTTFTQETAMLAANALKATSEGYYDVAEELLPGFGMFFFSLSREERLETMAKMQAALQA